MSIFVPWLWNCKHFLEQHIEKLWNLMLWGWELENTLGFYVHFLFFPFYLLYVILKWYNNSDFIRIQR